MPDYEYDIPMTEDYQQILLKLVEQSKKLKTLTATGSLSPDKTWQFDQAGEHWKTGAISGDPLVSFDCLELIKIYGNLNRPMDHPFILTPKAYKWAEYQKKNRIGKWWARLPGNVKDIMLAISFLLSQAMTIIQFLQAIKVIGP